MANYDFDVVTGPSMPSRRILPLMTTVKAEPAPAPQPAAPNALIQANANDAPLQKAA